ncbi:hypothetical protein [Phytohabitans rumicis]|uniref:hypothetical protein n=1 Tax=Phytohabitans rumicis TaxID=1076125 RepID=UPI0031EF9AFC
MTSDDDDVLIAELRRVAGEADPVPAVVVAAARAAITTRNLDHELARLVADSADADLGRSFEAVRGPARETESRLVSYEGGGVQVDLDLSPSGGGLRLIGQFSGAPVAECTLEQGDGTSRPVAVDDLGRFAVEDLPAGPVRLRYRSATGDLVRTAWITP